MKPFRILTVLAALGVVAFGTAQAQTTANFNFNSLDPTENPTGSITSTPFSLTSSGVTATFSSPADPGAFSVLSPAGFLSFTDDVLISSPGGGSGPALEVDFSQPLSSFTGDFATFGDGALTVTALSGPGGSMVGGSSATGTVSVTDPVDFPFPEGTITFNGGTFSSIILSDATDPAFALGDFSVTTAPTHVPEPSTLALMGLGLAAAALFGRRRQLQI
jgi:PEP-CTERM motif